mmetsp:Transcript_37030/g.93541  ORF Transcript_37030/g.93541 Transcript_37030/m.93541 type:complete len:276 (+) Transcript_37030:1-828(+)|eukprot:jgi/Tetstr1/445624/TSEL_003429.t1
MASRLAARVSYLLQTYPVWGPVALTLPLAASRSDPTLSHALCLEATSGLALVLAALALLCLHFHDAARQRLQLAAEALLRSDRGQASIGADLCFEDPALYELYERWRASGLIVRALDWATVAGLVAFQLKIATVEHCGLGDQLLSSVVTGMYWLTGHLRRRGCSTDVVSIYSMSARAVGFSVIAIMAIQGDECWGGLAGGRPTGSLPAACVLSGVYAMYSALMFYTPQAYVLSNTLFTVPASTLVAYVLFLFRDGTVALAEDPSRWGLFWIFAAA